MNFTSIKKGAVSITDESVAQMIRYVSLAFVIAAAIGLLYWVGTISSSQSLDVLINATRSMKVPGVGYSGNYVPALIKNKTVAGAFTVSGNQIYNTDGGEVTVVGNGIGVIITSNNVSSSSCVKVAPQISAGDIASLKVNGTTFSSTISEVDAEAACTDGRTNTLVITTNN